MFVQKASRIMEQVSFEMLFQLIRLRIGNSLSKLFLLTSLLGINSPMWTNCLAVDISLTSLSGFFYHRKYFPAFRPQFMSQQRREMSHVSSPTEHTADPRNTRWCWRSQDQACKCFGFHGQIQKWQRLGHVQDEDQAPFEERGKSSAPYSGSLCWVCCILMPEKNVNIESCQKQPWEEGVLAGPADGSLHTCRVRDISEWIQGKYLTDTQRAISPYVSPEARRAAKRRQLFAGPLFTGWFKSLFQEACLSVLLFTTSALCPVSPLMNFQKMSFV